MNNKTLMFLLSLIFNSGSIIAQYDSDIIKGWFEEIKSASEKNITIWNRNIYGEIILVDPDTRIIYSNSNDSINSLTRKDGVFTGVLPDHINIANTSLKWNGREWAMIMLPLPESKHDRLNLLAHELFHRIQPSLGFSMSNTDNHHLDKKEGRIYMRLELEALSRAVSSTGNERKTYLRNAFIFRKYRNMLYHGSDSTENLLELNEGMAEYTGIVFSGRNNAELIRHFNNSVNEFKYNPTFVRSSAYQTIPMYGYIMSETNTEWNKNISGNTNLTDYFINELKIDLPNDLKGSVSRISDLYDGRKIITEEIARDEKAKIRIAGLKNKFSANPHFEIRFEQMNVSFDPRNIVPLDEYGTYYPNIRVTDRWGILTVNEGALMSPDWDKIIITAPQKTEHEKITGEGWVLELKDGYDVVDVNGNYLLMKR